MKPIPSNLLIEQLQGDVRAVLLRGIQLQQVPIIQLQQKPNANKWSIAQVLEHLNFYNRYYNKAIEDQLHLSDTKASGVFYAGWLGTYFTRLMQPDANGKISKKMKAPKKANPSAQPNGFAMLEEFIQHQQQLLQLLQIAGAANLNEIRIAISINKWIKLKLGDTFRFLIAHELRHFLQIEQTLASFC